LLGAKASGAAFVGEPTPMDTPGAPTDPQSLLTNKEGRGVTAAVLYEVAKAAPSFAPFLDAVAEFTPVFGGGIIAVQSANALNKGVQAVKQSVDNCYAGK
jgi:hypothetical protein